MSLSKAEYNKRARARRVTAGLCAVCGSVQVSKGAACETCKQAQTERRRRIVEQRQQRGLCTKCGNAQPKPGRKMCCDCLAAAVAKNSRGFQRRIARGDCGSCGRYSVEQGKTMCADCLLKMRINAKKRSKRRIQQGLCVYCGKQPRRKYAQFCLDCSRIKTEPREVKEIRRAQEQVERQREWLTFVETVRLRLPSMTPRQRQAVTLRYGLEDGKKRKLEQVGLLMGISRERVRQLIAVALPSEARKRARRVREETPVEWDFSETIALIAQGFNEVMQSYQ